MLIIDLSQPTNELILNVTPLITENNPVLQMRIKTQFDFKEKIVPLGVNMSLFPTRYDSFIITSSLLTGLNEGLALYEVFEDSDMDKVLEMGLATIKNTVQEPDIDFVSLPDDDTPKFKVYVRR